MLSIAINPLGVELSFDTDCAYKYGCTLLDRILVPMSKDIEAQCAALTLRSRVSSSTDAAINVEIFTT